MSTAYERGYAAVMAGKGMEACPAKNKRLEWVEGFDDGCMKRAQAMVAIECPKRLAMAGHACEDRTQCWEPCGDLGKSEEFAVVSTANPEGQPK